MEHPKEFIHKHALILIEDPPHDDAKSADGEEKVGCRACGEVLEGPTYRCQYITCKFYLHKACALLEFTPEFVDHPLHPSHPLTFLEKPPYSKRSCYCNFCGKDHSGFVYHCDICNFDLDINCAFLFQSSQQNFHKLEHPFHSHPFTFIECYNKSTDNVCLGCTKELSPGLPIYRCLDCIDVGLRKDCAELPFEIDHPYHPKHPLKLILQGAPEHPDALYCSFCRDNSENYRGFVYYCSICLFRVTLEAVLPPNMTKATNHQHNWTLLSRLMSFVCDFCGTEGDRSPLLCTTCSLVVHKDCTYLPQTLRITRHHHRISHTYSLHRKKIESTDCRICYTEVDVDYGSYACSVLDCNYIAHVKCATHEEIWDGNEVDEEEEGETDESKTMISAIIEEIEQGGVMIATEIKHEYHDYNLRLTLTGEVKTETCCDACMRLIDIPFYSCGGCSFSLHKSCAELPRKKQHPGHIHRLRLTNDEYSFCNACSRYHHGYSYECDKSCDYKIDIQCSSLPDSLSHPSHEHRLFLDYKHHDSCSGCPKMDARQIYKCVKRCGFTLDFWCLTLPQVARFKYEKHTLSLAYTNADFDLTQLYCDICEEKRDPHPWFYYCGECDTTVHTKCVLGALPFVKLETTYDHKRHPHYLTFVDNIWHCRPCHICNKLCFRQALECKESDECNLIVHWNCRRSLKWPPREITPESQAS